MHALNLMEFRVHKEASPTHTTTNLQRSTMCIFTLRQLAALQARRGSH